MDFSDPATLQRFLNQSLATAYNYIHTGRPNLAVQVLNVVQKSDPANPYVGLLFDLIAAYAGIKQAPNLTQEFGCLWLGEDLNDRSIEIFCDQGMGDVINMLRYLHVMKSRWNCRIIVNCYAYYEQLEPLLTRLPYIDQVVKFHEPCDFHTNIFSIPALLSGIELDIYYPAHFEMLMAAGVPDQPIIQVEPACLEAECLKIALAWRSNPKNSLSVIKSVNTDLIKKLRVEGATLYTFDEEKISGCQSVALGSLLDTAAVLAAVDVVVSVDTVLLHLAGAMGKRAFGLIPYDCDPRWGTEETTVWYPSVTLIRQTHPNPKDWVNPVMKVREHIESLIRIH
jgi:hypothetical protein